MEPTKIAPTMPVQVLLYTREQAAALAQVSLPVLDRWIKNDGLPVVRLRGTRYRIPAQAFQTWLENMATSSTDDPLEDDL